MKICLTASKMLEAMLPDQKADAAKTYCPSRYNLFHESKKGTYIFNLLTRRLANLTEEEAQLMRGTSVSGSVALAEPLIAKRYLVPEGTDETSHYVQLYTTQDMFLSAADQGITLYRILPTTGCNARCFYCFEQGVEIQNMTTDTADAVIEYIKKTRSPGKKIRLDWFGGEPMLRPAILDRICAGITEAGIEFSSTMTTNGSLLVPSQIEKAKKDWHLDKVQITLDGVGQEHDRRKAYVALPDSYTLTLNNIAALVAAGIGVTVRMNMDLQNAQSIHALYDHLRTQYTPEDRITFDPALLFEELIGGPKLRSEQQQTQLRKHWLDLRKRIGEDGYFRFGRMEETLPRWFCMANSATAVTILPDGNLTTCEIGCEHMYYGDVRQGITKPEVLKTWRKCTDLREKCKTCTYLPECAGFSLCEYEASDCRVVAENTAAYQLEATVKKYEDR